ncbi:hypothetical protein GCM10022422_37150 [Flavobacterium ginsengisoli]|uniref:Uncharacterized protein n=1 Tax=Flavobacterium ginsengisoli TaxID=871694 RepID=A0ABP7FV31_9FLAO
MINLNNIEQQCSSFKKTNLGRKSLIYWRKEKACKNKFTGLKIILYQLSEID